MHPNHKSIFLFTIFLPISIFCYSQNLSRGLDYEEEAYASVPKKAKLTRSLDEVPPVASLKKYSPLPGDQGQFGTCTAWSSAYCGRTIVEAINKGWTNQQTITSNAFSPAFLFRLLRPDDANCVGGSGLLSAMQSLKVKGNVFYKEVADKCVATISASQLTSASNNKVKDYMRIFESKSPGKEKIQAVKKAIAERKPVIIGMICPPSFNNAKDVWTPTEQPNSVLYGGHAMCVVGYDDTKGGGSFEIQNSWGTRWGNQGYIWIKYETFANFVNYAYEFIDLPEVKPATADLSGEIKLMLSTNLLMPVNLQTADRGLIVVSSQTKAVPGPLTIYKTTNAYTTGTRFRIYISNNQPAYVYAISADLTNAVTKIFPYEEGISAALTDKRNDVAIPDEQHFIEFDDKPGKDFLCVLYCREALDINTIVSNISAQQGSFSERVFKVLGDKLADPKNILFSKTKIAFEGFSGGKNIVAMLVEIEHK
ncbi:MAG: C1 family peptidase [Ferruginibacter sp.]